MQIPSTTAFGRDDNNRPAVGGFDPTGANPLTAEMAPGSAAGLGILKVTGTIVTTPPASPTISYFNSKVVPTLAAAAVCATPATTVSKVSIENADGASPNGNTAVVWVGYGAFTLPNVVGNAAPIYPGQSIDFAIDNPARLFCLSATANQVIKMIST